MILALSLLLYVTNPTFVIEKEIFNNHMNDKPGERTALCGMNLCPQHLVFILNIKTTANPPICCSEKKNE